MGLEITPASDADYDIVHNLARFYIYDISEHAGLNFPADGLFNSEDLFANYWGGPAPGARGLPAGADFRFCFGWVGIRPDLRW